MKFLKKQLKRKGIEAKKVKYRNRAKGSENRENREIERSGDANAIIIQTTLQSPQRTKQCQENHA